MIQTLRQDPAHPVQWIAQGQVSRETPQQLPDSGVEAVMTVDASKTPAFTGALTGNGFTVYRIERVIYPPMGAPERTMQLKSFQEQVAAMAAQDMVVAYRTALRAEADVEINEKSLEKQN